MGISVLQRLASQGYEALRLRMRDGTVNDWSQYKNHGTIVGGMRLQKSENGMSGYFDGTGYVNIGNATIVLPNVFTLCAWVKEREQGIRPLVGWDITLANLYPAVYTSYNAGRPLVYLGAANYRFWTAPTADMRWHFWTFVVTGNAQADINNAACYLDANPLTVQSTNASSATSAKTYMIVGWGVNSVLNRLSGYCDEVILYNGYNLNAWEVATLMAETKPRD